jgi:hypothetical protein
MKNRKKYRIFALVPLLLCVSCLHTKTDTTAIPAGIKIVQGNAMLKINGEIEKDADHYDNPAAHEKTITKKETKNLSAGKKYEFSVLPGEVVTINITSTDSKNVEVIAYQSGRERKYTILGTDRTGLFVAFQNKRVP